MVLEIAHKLFSDEKLAHEIGMEACRIIKEEYLRFPPSLCGWSSKPLVASLIYILSLRRGIRKTQGQVARTCGVSEAGLRNGVLKWFWINPGFRKEAKDLAPDYVKRFLELLPDSG